ncbi:MAG: hypothetical protein B5M56_01795, partial [Desulfococcus sp. 4484_241]
SLGYFLYTTIRGKLPLQNALFYLSTSGYNLGWALFSYLSAIFIFAGIGTYIVMFWNDMGSAMRIVVTLGTGYILLIVLISTLHKKKSSKIILPLTLASAFMMSNGWFVLIREVFPYGNNWRFVMLYVFGVMALHQCLLFSKYRLTVLMFTSIFSRCSACLYRDDYRCFNFLSRYCLRKNRVSVTG